MKLRMLKKPALLLALSGMICIGGTAAYFTDYDNKRNIVAVGHNTTTIEEEFPDPDPTPIPENPEYTKKVWVANRPYGEDGFNVDSYIRVSLSYSNNDIGKAVTLEGLDTANWYYDSTDQYYYYKKVVKEGQATTPLFTGIKIDSSKVEDTYKDAISEFNVNVYSESVSSQGFTDYQSAWDYYSKTIS